MGVKVKTKTVSITKRKTKSGVCPTCGRYANGKKPKKNG